MNYLLIIASMAFINFSCIAQTPFSEHDNILFIKFKHIGYQTSYIKTFVFESIYFHNINKSKGIEVKNLTIGELDSMSSIIKHRLFNLNKLPVCNCDYTGDYGAFEVSIGKCDKSFTYTINCINCSYLFFREMSKDFKNYKTNTIQHELYKISIYMVDTLN